LGQADGFRNEIVFRAAKGFKYFFLIQIKLFGGRGSVFITE
jgi:hypothetical protein